jgi:hypothetical protein
MQGGRDTNGAVVGALTIMIAPVGSAVERAFGGWIYGLCRGVVGTNRFESASGAALALWRKRAVVLAGQCGRGDGREDGRREGIRLAWLVPIERTGRTRVGVV